MMTSGSSGRSNVKYAKREMLIYKCILRIPSFPCLHHLTSPKGSNHSDLLTSHVVEEETID